MANTSVSLVGNLTSDPVLRTASTGLVANFSIAVSEGSKDNPKTGYYDVVCWRDLAQNVSDTLHKGMRVVVMGTLIFSTWEAKDGGGKRSKVQVTADAIGPDLRFATAHVTGNTRPSVTPNQQQYPSDADWTETAKRELVSNVRDFRDEPF